MESTATREHTNVEIKARLHTSYAVDDPRLGKLTGVLVQVDTYFFCCQGTLKLREETTAAGTSYALIHYDRQEIAGPKRSCIVKTPVEDGEGVLRVLGAAYDTMRVVKKRRVLYMRGRTRVHIDAVEGLGNFVELEVVLRPAESEEQGRIEAREIMTDLGIAEEDLIACSYLDM